MKKAILELVENDEQTGFTVSVSGSTMRIAEMIGSAIASICSQLPDGQRAMFQAVMSKTYEMEAKNRGKK